VQVKGSEFRDGIDWGAQTKQQFSLSDAIEGMCFRVIDPKREIADT
jgi:hypothetical protein